MITLVSSLLGLGPTLMHRTVNQVFISGVVNWDYLALKVNSKTREVEWRKTFGQPRGFDARYIHDEMYSVALDPSGNYLLLGGSGDEYSYSETDPNTGWSSDIWVSYLVVLDMEVIIHNIMNYYPEYVITFVNTYL